MNEIGKKMNERRRALGLTLEEVGRAVGVGKSTVRRWEEGMIKNMGRDKIAALAKVLQMNPVEFVQIDPESARIAASVQVDASKIYSNPSAEDKQRLEALHQDPQLGLLFDRTSKMKPEDVAFMLQMADRILKERDGGDG